jgi:hypothetical protein
MVKRRTTCRLCDSSDVELVLALAPCPPVDAYIERSQLEVPQPAFPLDLFVCRDCGHAQLLDVVAPELLFGDYMYETSSSPGLVEHFRRYADAVLDFSGLKPGAFAIDVGSNDGTLLRFLKDRDLRVLGVDPAKSIADRATSTGIETISSFLNREVAERIRDDRGPADLVTANNVFAHSDDMGGMADSVRALLSPDGLFVFEVSWLLDMLDGMLFDLIYHEHLCYHSVRPLRRFLARHDLELIDVIHVPSKGGSLRCFAQPSGAGRPVGPSVANFLEREDAAGLYSEEIYQRWSQRIDDARTRTRELVQRVRDEGNTIAGYGASATTTVLLHDFELGDAIEFLIDDIPERQGRFSPGHHIPVLSADSLSERRPDYVMVLAWRFAEMIIGKHGEYLAGGGQFVVPLPELKIVS